jgi:cytosine/adenosine deaminase-related metal-dependent hydrolase
VIVTDRFAGAVDTPLRRQGVALSQRYGLRMQTHLNEQFAEKAWIERLYPTAKSYTDVYRRDGLFDCGPILAHCIRMSAEEFDLVAATSDIAIAHCPVSNTLLGSGVMPLDEVIARNIPYALCTDVGASPTTSLLCEMVQFLRVHAGRSRFATPSEALYRTTLAPAQILGCADRLGSFDVGKEFSFIEVRRQTQVRLATTADDAIRQDLLEFTAADEARYRPGNDRGSLIDRLQETGVEVGADLAVLTDDVETTARHLDDKVIRVTRAGRTVWWRSGQD